MPPEPYPPPPSTYQLGNLVLEALAQRLKASFFFFFLSEFPWFAACCSYQAPGFPHRSIFLPVQRLSGSRPVVVLLFSHLQLSSGSPVSLVLFQLSITAPARICDQLCISYFVLIPSATFSVQVSPEGSGSVNLQVWEDRELESHNHSPSSPPKLLWELWPVGQGWGTVLWVHQISLLSVFRHALQCLVS